MDFSERYDELYHYGMPRRSGRYPWGSGEHPFQRSGDFLARVNELKSQHMSETDIARGLGMTTTQLRAYKSIAKQEQTTETLAAIRSLKSKGYSTTEIARQLGKNESTIRSMLDAQEKSKKQTAMGTAAFLKEQVDTKGMIDVGSGVEKELGISKERLTQAIHILEAEGYNLYGGRVPQATNPGRQTTIKVLAPPDANHRDIYEFGNVHSVKDYITRDGGETYEKKFVYPASMDGKRIYIRYAEDGGKERDGTIDIRRNVPDLDLGGSHYSQVRILVDDDRYLKGMAWYSDDIPEGYDIVFNTNKKRGTPMREVLKPISNDPDNPFGSLIKETGGQSYYYDEKGNKKLSLINKRADEGDWGEWADTVPPQFLAKQPRALVEKQLGLSLADYKSRLESIQSLTNPTIRKHFLEEFAEDCDAASVHLKAAALPRQKYQVILPINSLKDNECYAPNYPDGETLALVRFPFAGLFEMPIVKNNIKNAEGNKRISKNAMDAAGLNSRVAERMSGADFDGDTVMVIPVKNTGIKNRPPLKDLEGFDPKEQYPERPGMKYMKTDKHDNTQIEMGKISNLITDMTIKGATDSELARAVKHSMVVIDAGKHKLDYKLSEAENGIAALKKKYQGHIDENGRYRQGASTLISRAGAEASVDKRIGSPIVDKETGELSWKTAPDKLLYYNKYSVNKKTGEVKVTKVKRTEKSTQMAETKDARTLSTGHLIEETYASYANELKDMANKARKEAINTKEIERSPSAALVYKDQVEAIKTKVGVALMNAPRERQAQLIAASKLNALKQDNPDITKKELKKKAQQYLTEARNRVGAQRRPPSLDDKEYEAIQAGALSKSLVRDLLKVADPDMLKEKAMPRETITLTPAKENKIRAMKASGYYTNAQIAEAVGLSATTVSRLLNEKG